MQVILCLLIIFSSGCDKIENLKSKLTKQNEPVPAQIAVPVSVEKPAQRSGNELARIGSWSITKEEFNERLAALKEVVPEFDVNNPEARKLVLDELVRQQLLVVDAEQRGVANNKDIMAAVDEFRRTLIVRQVATDLTQNISVTEEEARQFYEEQKDILREPEQWRVREIVVETQIEANELLVELLKGADFAELAKLHSISESADDGGDLGYLEQEPFQEMVNELLKLKEGEVSGVFKGPEGFYIVKLDDIKGGELIPYEDIKEDIIQNRTIIKQQQAILDYIENLEQKIKVEINESLLN
jgi:peptidyl-prolyl cis-trans isomerase C